MWNEAYMNPDIGDRKVLVADDDPFTRELVTEMLKDLGFSGMETAQNGEEVLSVVADHGDSIALLILDLMMPGKDGLEILGELAQRGFKGKILFVSGAATALLDSAVFFSTRKGLNVIGKMKKPFSETELDTVLRNTPD